MKIPSNSICVSFVLAFVMSSACSGKPSADGGNDGVSALPADDDDDDESESSAGDDEGSIETIPSVTKTDSSVDSPSDTGDRLCPGTDADGTCYPIDLLFVIDNSGTMGEEQVNLAKNFPRLIERLINIKDSEGKPAVPNVNIMITSTDLGHPICTQFQPMDYEPLKGHPVTVNCLDRLGHFTGLEPENPPVFEEACTDFCPDKNISPNDDRPFIHFGVRGMNSNIVDDKVSEALSCMGPQGVSGCGFEQPLEAMMQALNPGAPWNKGDQPFLRKGKDSVLGIAIVTDEVDCSVDGGNGGYEFFTNPEKDDFWEPNPDKDNKKTGATSAVCWNAGVECKDDDNDGVYEECKSKEQKDPKKVLQPLGRYIDYLGKTLREKPYNKHVVMLGILGVPKVTEHNPEPPFQPTAGGVLDLVYRDWQDGDILPADADKGLNPAKKKFDFGIGPGCTGKDADGNYTGQAVPPVRIKEVCESLNYEEEVDGKKVEQIRCCIESICDEDFSPAIDCLTGLIQKTIVPG